MFNVIFINYKKSVSFDQVRGADALTLGSIGLYFIKQYDETSIKIGNRITAG